MNNRSLKKDSLISLKNSLRHKLGHRFEDEEIHDDQDEVDDEN